MQSLVTAEQAVKFQFHKVQLKVKQTDAIIARLGFQFHKVQLKGFS